MKIRFGTAFHLNFATLGANAASALTGQLRERGINAITTPGQGTRDCFVWTNTTPSQHLTRVKEHEAVAHVADKGGLPSEQSRAFAKTGQLMLLQLHRGITNGAYSLDNR